MKPLNIAKGARVYIGAPAQPLPEAITNGLGSLVSKVPGLVEAHLLQCYVEGEEAARQVLVVVPVSRSQTQAVLDAVGSELPGILPSAVPLDVWPLSPAIQCYSQSETPIASCLFRQR